MVYRIKSYVWNKLFSLDRLLSGLQRLMARLEKLAAMRRSECARIDEQISILQDAQFNKGQEAMRAERIKDRFEALIS
jgi:hypothetical protein